ncbi:MAG: B12-binding domain-containing radical SAM protein, partial [Muricoprocola sp.]
MSMKRTRKILLTAINAKYIHSNPAIYSLRAYAKKYRDYVDIAEFTINHYADDILQGIYRKHPDVVAFSCYIWNLDMVEQVIRELPKILPGVSIWVGGPEVSYDAEQFLETHPQVTGVMIGEGEETFCELAGRYVRQWEGIPAEEEILPGTAQRQADGRIVFGAVRPLLDLNQIPFLYEDLSEFENRIIYYESSRGCPFSCSYCLSSIDKSVRFRDAQTVMQELQFFLDKKVPQVKFVDRTFNCRHSHSMAIWSYILEHDNGITNF